ncbi:uncharacterized protein B0T15DRAFT_574120 [Chaetomium strumarium]|uniref:Uncharacterized protein n=1 Tax=Chaetomium strumarium TaxID=1170767 RepID=A0AAJ0M362_9PEZI|nr:hypothetical protein B0T15DRAFT_574120 [Chaetomium strumarium]
MSRSPGHQSTPVRHPTAQRGTSRVRASGGNGAQPHCKSFCLSATLIRWVPSVRVEEVQGPLWRKEGWFGSKKGEFIGEGVDLCTPAVCKFAIANEGRKSVADQSCGPTFPDALGEFSPARDIPPADQQQEVDANKQERIRKEFQYKDKAASESAKPASSPTRPPETPRQSSPTKSLLRRTPHLNRVLKARVRKLEKGMDHLESCEKHLAGALEQLAAAREQIHQLNAAMYYVLHQPPHNGGYKDANYNNCFTPKWERFGWECPASRWDEHLRHIFRKDGYKQEAWRSSRWARE